MEKVVYKVGNFVDYAGNTREVILVAVSREVEIDKDFGPAVIDFADFSDKEIKKELRFAVAAQNVGDKPNTELGKRIAYGKAMKDKSCFSKLYSTDKGLINRTMVNAILDQEFQYFIENPGKYLKGYNRNKEVFLALKK